MPIKNQNRFLASLVLLSGALLVSCSVDTRQYREWDAYGGSKQRLQYSSLSQIDTLSVKNLKVAWVYHTNDADSNTSMKVNPIVIDKIMYVLSPKLKLTALDAITGKSLWKFDPYESRNGWEKIATASYTTCRGLAFYAKDQLLFYTAGPFLICVSAATGEPVLSFGQKGKIDLHNDLGRDVSGLKVLFTSPGTVYKDMIIVGSSLSEEAETAPGHIRAYDVHSGKLRWIFHTIPYPEEPGFETWDDPIAYKYNGGANAWGGFSLDEEKGIVFVPTGSATFDFYGGKRNGDNLFANCVLALDATTGKRIWHYQTIHHDLWDWDLPTSPVPVTVTKDGSKREAVVQVTKTGHIFLLDRLSGKPLYSVKEKAVPVNTSLEGERMSPTQPIPTFFPPFARQGVSESDLNTNIPDSSLAELRKRFSSYKNRGQMYSPPSPEGTLMSPGWEGGAEWGGPSFDPVTGILYINANEIPTVLTLTKIKDEPTNTIRNNLQAGKALYTSKCSGCHGNDLKDGIAPSLSGIDKKLNERQFKEFIAEGRGMMPAFKQLSAAEKTALAVYLLQLKEKEKLPFREIYKEPNPYYDIPYALRIEKFLTNEGLPAIAPPWGTLNAVNLNTGKMEWKISLGETGEEYFPTLKGITGTGTENFGGSIVTAGGLVFIAATPDKKFRAFNKYSGQLLWETELPAAGYATPATYEIKGRQYIVIACGGNGHLNTSSGDAYVAFALTDTN